MYTHTVEVSKAHGGRHKALVFLNLDEGMDCVGVYNFRHVGKHLENALMRDHELVVDLTQTLPNGTTLLHCTYAE